MAESTWMITIASFLHDLFTVVWIGGMIALGLGVLPAVRRSLGLGPQMQLTVSAFQERFRWFAYVCIVGLVATGVLLSRNSPGFRSWFSWADSYSVLLSLKHLLVIIMVVIVIVRSVFMTRKTPQGTGLTPGRTAGPPRPSRRARISMLLLFVNIVLGVVVLFFSAATATMSAA